MATWRKRDTRDALMWHSTPSCYRWPKSGFVETTDTPPARAQCVWCSRIPPEGTAEPRTLKDDVRREIRAALEKIPNHSGLTGLVIPLSRQRETLVDALAPLVCDLIDHALQVDRVDRGLLPYDEE